MVKEYFDQISYENIEKLNEIYKIDLKIFGYTKFNMMSLQYF